MTEMERFVDAFERLIKRDEFPTPTKLNIEMGRPGSRNNLPGRLSRRRRELLTAAGYRQHVTRRDDDGYPIHWTNWHKVNV